VAVLRSIGAAAAAAETKHARKSKEHSLCSIRGYSTMLGLVFVRQNGSSALSTYYISSLNNYPFPQLYLLAIWTSFQRGDRKIFFTKSKIILLNSKRMPEMSIGNSVCL